MDSGNRHKRLFRLRVWPVSKLQVKTEVYPSAIGRPNAGSGVHRWAFGVILLVEEVVDAESDLTVFVHNIQALKVNDSIRRYFAHCAIRGYCLCI